MISQGLAKALPLSGYLSIDQNVTRAGPRCGYLSIEKKISSGPALRKPLKRPSGYFPLHAIDRQPLCGPLHRFG
jgi:hypothetical protein